MIVLIYLFKLVSCSALFGAYYYFALRNKRMHQYNRFYILASVTISIVLPLIKVPLLSSFINDQQTMANSFRDIAFGGWEKEVVITTKQGILNPIVTAQNGLIAIYAAGLLITLLPILNSLTYIRSIAARHHAKPLGSINFYNTAEPGTPFSFFNAVFWNQKISVETDEGQQMLRHELYHINQKHSYDILFMQLVCCLFWFNPFYYFLNRELKVIHEFLADEYASSGTDKHHYAEVLVMQAVSPKELFITNQFFYNQIKRRIAMILQNDNTRYSNARKAMTVPMALLIFCACSVKNRDDEGLRQAPLTEKTVTTARPDSSQYVAPPERADKEFQAAAKNADPILTKIEIESGFPGGASAWMRYLNKTFKYPMEAQEQEIQGTVIIQFIVDKLGNVSDVHAIKGPDKGGLKEEAIRVIKASGKWLPGINAGKKVNSYKKQPITFKLEAE